MYEFHSPAGGLFMNNTIFTITVTTCTVAQINTSFGLEKISSTSRSRFRLQHLKIPSPDRNGINN